MKQYAYVRISTVQQNTDRQTMALGGFDIPEEQIFTEKRFDPLFTGQRLN